LTKTIKEKQDLLSTGPYGRSEPVPDEDIKMLAAVLAFEKIFDLFVSTYSGPRLLNGTAKKTEQIVKEEDDDAVSLIDVSKPGKPVLTVFANAQGPKQLFSSFQKTIKVGEADQGDGLGGSVEVSVPLRESALPNFIVSTTIPASTVQKKLSKGITFAERFPTPKTIPQIQPPKTSNKLLTKASTIGWVSEEALSRSRSRRTYNWCATRLNSGKSLNYSKIHESLNEPASPEERRRQRDRALSTGSAQRPQSEATRMAAQHAKDEALFRSAFSSFAPCYDNSDAVVPTQTKSDLWWSKVGRQRAERVFAESFVEPADSEAEAKDEKPTDLDEEAKMFKEAVETFDPSDAQIDPALEKKDEDQTMIEILGEVSELIETLYSYQRIRNSTVSSTTAPMTPVGQRTALTEIVGTASTPSAAEVDIYKILKTQLTLLICQLPPSAVTRLDGDKLKGLNISTNIIVETEDAQGIMEDDSASTQKSSVAPHQHADPAAHPSAGRNVARTAPLAPARPNNFYPPAQLQPRTPSASYPRPTPSYSQTYTANAGRPQYTQAGYAQPGYAQSPMRVNYQHGPQYYAQQQVPNRMNYAAGYAGTPQGQTRQYAQPPTQNYARPSGPAGYGFQPPASTPQMRTASPMQATNANSPHFRNPSGGRTQYYPPATANAIGPTGFHTTLTAQEQQNIMERQRQIALQNQARTAAMGQASPNAAHQPAPSNYTTPSRHSSDTPQPAAQMNGTLR
jgi:hypothetical protein